MLTTNLSLSSNRLSGLYQRTDQNSVSPLTRQLSASAASSNISLKNTSATYEASNIASDDKPTDTSTSRWFHMDRLISACESDPAYAKQAAEELALASDGMVLYWEDAPSPANAEAWNAWVNQTIEFEKVAAPVNTQRLELYNSLKAQGKPDLDIVKAILNFNGNQSAEYQIKTGFMKLDVTA